MVVPEDACGSLTTPNPVPRHRVGEVGFMAAIIELLTFAAIIITVVAGLLQIYDRLAKKKKPDE